MEQLTTEEPKIRPQFLTVLCILTYIGVGIGIIGSIVGWWGMRTVSAMMDGTSSLPDGTDMSSMPGMEDMMDQMGPALKWANVILGVEILGCILCLIGALQMWKLKKIGFYIYVVGEITPPIISALLLGGSAFNGIQLLGLIVPIVFVILYAINYKHLSS